MKNLRTVITILAVLFYSAVHAQENPVAKLVWQQGSGEGIIGDKAKIKIPAAHRNNCRATGMGGNER